MAAFVLEIQADMRNGGDLRFTIYRLRNVAAFCYRIQQPGPLQKLGKVRTSIGPK
jgi:hypothetical protein